MRANSAVRSFRGLGCLGAAVLLAGCSVAGLPALRPATAEPALASASEVGETVAPLAYAQPGAGTTRYDALIARYSAEYDVPEALIRRVIQRESGYNAAARNGPFLGLMQIRHATARSMGYGGGPEGLLDADTNLKYAVKYLRGAYIVGGRDEDAAVRLYSRGYYYDAKRQGLLDEVGL